MKFKISAYFGALFSALLASSCCWLPLLLVFLGISSTTVAARLSEYRPLFLIVALLLLFTAFFFDRKKRRKEVKCCQTKNERGRLNPRRFMVWGTTLLVFVLIAAPYYHKYLSSRRDEVVSQECDNNLFDKMNKLENEAAGNSDCCP